MANLSIPYVSRQLARRSGGGGGGAVAQPRVPDISGVYRGLGELGEDLSDASAQMSKIVAAKQKARDTATLTALEASIDEQVGAKQQEILRDARISPFDYREQLQSYRDSLLQSAEIPERLKPLAQARVQASTSRFLIGIDAEGTKRGVEQALQTLDTRADQLIRNQLADPSQAGAYDTQLRDLLGSYVDSGIISQPEATARLSKIRDTSAIYQVQSAIRLDPDNAVMQLEKGPGANLGIPPEAYPKLVDEARRVQRERFEFANAQEAKVEKDTRQAQQAREAELFGQPIAVLRRARDSRDISPEGYERLVRYRETKEHEARAEARAKASLGLQMQDRRDRQTDAQLSIMATTGQMSVDDLIKYGAEKQLPATAIDGAIAKAKAYESSQSSEFRNQHSQAEQILKTAFFKGEFDIMDDPKQQAYNNALIELTAESKAYGGAKNPIDIAPDIARKHLATIATDTQQRMSTLQGLLEYQSPDALEAAKPTVPKWKYDEQRRLMRQIEQTQQELDTETQMDFGRGGKKDPRSFWQRVAPSALGGQEAPTP